jgi:hypothetical protein
MNLELERELEEDRFIHPHLIIESSRMASQKLLNPCFSTEDRRMHWPRNL